MRKPNSRVRVVGLCTTILPQPEHRDLEPGRHPPVWTWKEPAAAGGRAPTQAHAPPAPYRGPWLGATASVQQRAGRSACSLRRDFPAGRQNTRDYRWESGQAALFPRKDDLSFRTPTEPPAKPQQTAKPFASSSCPEAYGSGHGHSRVLTTGFFPKSFSQLGAPTQYPRTGTRKYDSPNTQQAVRAAGR